MPQRKLFYSYSNLDLGQIAGKVFGSPREYKSVSAVQQLTSWLCSLSSTVLHPVPITGSPSFSLSLAKNGHVSSTPRTMGDFLLLVLIDVTIQLLGNGVGQKWANAVN